MQNCVQGSELWSEVAELGRHVFRSQEAYHRTGEINDEGRF